MPLFAGNGSASDWATVLLTLIGGIGAVGQYVRNSRHSRTKTAADEIQFLTDDESARTILKVIDWKSARVMIEDVGDQPKSIKIDEQAFLLAFRHHSVRRDQVANYNASADPKASEPTKFTTDESRLRDMMDGFLGRLERINALIDSGVISAGDFKLFFQYWLDLIDENGGEPSANFTEAKRATFWRYVRGYKFEGVMALFARHGKVIVARRKA